MRYPKIIDELNGSVVTAVQLVLNIHNTVAFVKNYIKIRCILFFRIIEYLFLAGEEQSGGERRNTQIDRRLNTCYYIIERNGGEEYN